MLYSLYRNTCMRHCSNFKRFCTSKSHKLSLNCWKCGSKLSPQFCIFCDSCNKIQKINIDNISYFDIFSLKPIYRMDPKVLESSFKHLQNLIHPDKFNNESIHEKEISIFNSSIINQAYSVLKSPVDRIAYLLSINGCDVLSENSGTYTNNPALMIEIFNLREEIENLSNINELEVKGQEIVEIANKLSSEIEILWDRDDISRVIPHAVRMKYLFKVYNTFMIYIYIYIYLFILI